MKSARPEEHDVALASILEDAAFMLRTMYAVLRTADQHGHVPSMALLPTFSLMTWESRKWLAKNEPAIADTLPDEELDLIEGIRNASKWFESDPKGTQASLARFRRVVENAKAEFLGHSPHRWARFLEGDLGRYVRRGRVILNTHALQLLLPESRPGGDAFLRMGATMSRQAIALVDVDEHAASFVDGIGQVLNRDIKSDKYYGRAAEKRLDYAGYLHVIWSSLAFLRLMTPEAEGDDAPMFKAKYVVYYHAVRTIQQLQPSLVHGLTSRVDGDHRRHFRNELIHYKPNSFTPLEALDAARPRQALVEHTFDARLENVAAHLSDNVEELYTRMAHHLRVKA